MVDFKLLLSREAFVKQKPIWNNADFLGQFIWDQNTITPFFHKSPDYIFNWSGEKYISKHFMYFSDFMVYYVSHHNIHTFETGLMLLHCKDEDYFEDYHLDLQQAIMRLLDMFGGM